MISPRRHPYFIILFADVNRNALAQVGREPTGYAMKAISNAALRKYEPTLINVFKIKATKESLKINGPDLPLMKRFRNLIRKVMNNKVILKDLLGPVKSPRAKRSRKRRSRSKSR